MVLLLNEIINFAVLSIVLCSNSFMQHNFIFETIEFKKYNVLNCKLVILNLYLLLKGEKDPYAVSDLNTDETATVMQQIQMHRDQLEKEFENYAEELAGDNDLLRAIQSYRSTFREAKSTAHCAGEEPPSDSDDDLMTSYIDDCEEALPSDDLKVFSNKLKSYKAKVKDIDNTLKKNEETCSANPTTCEQTKVDALDQLDNILTPEVKDELNSDATGILMKFQENLKACFKRGTKELEDDLNLGVAAMKKCLKDHST